MFLIIRPRGKYSFTVWTVLAFGLLFVLPLAAEEVAYKITPSSFEWGKTYHVTVSTADGKCSPKDWEDVVLVSPVAPDIEIDATKIEVNKDTCKLFAEVKIAEKAVSGSLVILVQRKGDGTPMGTIPVQVVPVAPEAIPPGLQPQVEVLWSVLPFSIAVDNFGHGIAKKYYCIEVVIGNNSGYSLQIASVGFDLNDSAVSSELQAQFRWPTSSYLITRATLERRHDVGPRATGLHLIQAFGLIATGMIPFFKAPVAHANFATGVNIYNDPFQKGFEAIFPDTTISQLLRLDATILRDDIIIPNNTQRRTLVFFPIKTLQEELGTTDQKSDFKPAEIKDALGHLVLVGDTLNYINRVRVLSGGQPENPTPPPATREELFQVHQGKQETKVIQGAGLLQAEVKSEPPDLVKCSPADKNGGSIECVLDGTKASPGKYKAILSTPGGKKELQIEVLQ